MCVSNIDVIPSLELDSTGPGASRGEGSRTVPAMPAGTKIPSVNPEAISFWSFCAGQLASLDLNMDTGDFLACSCLGRQKNIAAKNKRESSCV